MGLLSGGDQLTKNTTVPWQPAQAPLKFGMAEAKKLYQQKQGFKAPTFQTYVPFSQATNNALSGMEGLARQGNPLAAGSIDAVNGLLSGNSITTEDGLNGMFGQGPNALQQYGSGIASGANGINTGGAYRDIYNSGGGIDTGGGYDAMYSAGGPDALQQYGSGIASGGERIDTGGLYSDLYNDGGPNTEARLNALYDQTGNPYWEQAVNDQSSHIADDVQRQFSGLGRSGSAADTGALVNQLGEYRTKALSDKWDANIANQRGILGDVTGVQQARFGNKLNAAAGKTDVEGRNISNRLSAASALSGEQNQGIAARFNALAGKTGVESQNIQNQFNALSGETGVQGQNIGNQLNAAGMLSGEQQNDFANQRGLWGDIANVQQQNVNNRMGAVDRAPAAYEQQYAGLNKLAQVGSAREDLTQRRLQAKLDKFNTNQASGWNRLNAYNGAIGANSQGYNAQTSQVKSPSNPFGGALGGALGGASMFGVPGAIGGGILGLLSGL